MKSLKLPQIDSIEELARFWDTHDLTEFEEALEEVTKPVFERNSDTVIPLHLQPRELEAVKRVAQARGVAEAVLVHEWVLEKLHTSSV
jgi:predicted DNA binding CopG/RHH family protein